ncbi:hypothetical protein KEM48_011492 [Puccinia striiformis f. sp. tritici PST-130]|nr:hypothetical protein KEM48_011492 [Puccinia striiformis f. sp. tritici PST-130]
MCRLLYKFIPDSKISRIMNRRTREPLEVFKSRQTILEWMDKIRANVGRSPGGQLEALLIISSSPRPDRSDMNKNPTGLISFQSLRLFMMADCSGGFLALTERSAPATCISMIILVTRAVLNGDFSQNRDDQFFNRQSNGLSAD